MVDGRALGDYETAAIRNREEAKRFEELQWAGIALVGCDVDLEIEEIRSLPPTGVGATPDFEAILKAGEVVELELARVVVEDDLQQGLYYTALARHAEDVLRAANVPAASFIYRAYAATNIGAAEARRAGHELAHFIRYSSALKVRSTTLYPAGSEL